MSNATPPGWYPDTAAPGNERWWDGTAWTAHTRPYAAATQQFGPPVQPERPAGSGRGSGAGSGRTIALVVAGALVVGAAVTGAVLLGRDDDGTRPEAGPSGTAASPADTGTHDAPGDSPSPDSSADDGDPTVLVDQLNGITLPIPDGWEKSDSNVEEMLTMRTDESYRCPGSSSDFCYHGTVNTRTPNAGDADSAEKLAKEDIDAAAKGGVRRERRRYPDPRRHHVPQTDRRRLGERGRTYRIPRALAGRHRQGPWWLRAVARLPLGRRQ